MVTLWLVRTDVRKANTVPFPPKIVSDYSITTYNVTIVYYWQISESHLKQVYSVVLSFVEHYSISGTSDCFGNVSCELLKTRPQNQFEAKILILTNLVLCSLSIFLNRQLQPLHYRQFVVIHVRAWFISLVNSRDSLLYSNTQMILANCFNHSFVQ
uniref:Uncharacterized protein n=1 Tax=Hippocampus comes TaxID=109280 RepID=A0A3Q3D1T4_HIPCM